MPRPDVLVFDVNETLLDLSALDPLFAEIFGDAAMRSQWFASMLQLSFVGGLTGRYVDYTTAQRAALRMLAARAGRDLTTDAIEAVVDGMRRLPPHPDAASSLTRLRDAGFRVTALTNSVLDVAGAQMANAGLEDRFESIFSADEVRALKPSPAPYLMVAERCGVEIGDVCLVAAHAWDVSGALAAGAQAAFVARDGAIPIPIGEQPMVVAENLNALTGALITSGEETKAE